MYVAAYRCCRIHLRSGQPADNPNTDQPRSLLKPKHRVDSAASILQRKKFVFKNFISMLNDDYGQGLVEYALIIALVSVIATTALRELGGGANNSLTNASNQLS
jgi:pilus assembly protein Flp/PilA